MLWVIAILKTYFKMSKNIKSRRAEISKQFLSYPTSNYFRTLKKLNS